MCTVYVSLVIANTELIRVQLKYIEIKGWLNNFMSYIRLDAITYA